MHWGEAVGEVIVDSWGINGGGIGEVLVDSWGINGGVIGEVLVEAIREAGRQGGRE